MTRTLALLGLIAWGPLIAGSLVTFMFLVSPLEEAIAATNSAAAVSARELHVLQDIALNLTARRAEQEALEPRLAASQRRQALIRDLESGTSRSLELAGQAKSLAAISGFAEKLAVSIPGSRLLAVDGAGPFSFQMEVPLE